MTPRDFAIAELSRLFEEQRSFDSQFRNPTPPTYEERTDLTKGIVLHLVHQASRLLESCGAWKLHRRDASLENKARIQLDLADLFKLTIMLANAWGVTPEEFLNAAWEKSMIVRQKHAEDWIHTLKGPVALIDIDNVLADYSWEMVEFLKRKGVVSADRGEKILAECDIVTAESLRLDPDRWSALKHEFRVDGWKRRLRVVPMASEFLSWCKTQGLTIVLLTARPIGEYPNIYNDTLSWLRLHNMTFDYIWWADQKTERIPIELIPQIAFAVDDDTRHVTNYVNAGIRTYWFQWRATFDVTVSNPLLRHVRSFHEIVAFEENTNGLR